MPYENGGRLMELRKEWGQKGRGEGRRIKIDGSMDQWIDGLLLY